MNPSTILSTLNANELEHYGVLGMKWGVRKARETTGQKRRSSSGEKTYTFRDKETGKKYKIKASKNLSKDQLKALAKQKIAKAKRDKEKKRREKILSDPTLLYKHRKEFSKSEIESAMKQFEWEKKLKDLSVSRIKAGKDTVSNAVGFANAVIGGYNTAAATVNAFSDADSKLPLINLNPSKDEKKKKEK